MMYLLDTNICIYIINKHPKAVIEKVKQFQPHHIKLSAISIAELEYGAAKSKHQEKNRLAILNFVSSFDILPFDDQDAEYYGQIRAELEKKGKVIGAYDMQIAAQALAKDLILVTNNTSEFCRIKNLKFENWV